MPEWMETVRLALGAFLTSAGFGGLMTAAAAWLALRGVRERMKQDSATESADRQDRLEADARERWWKLAMYLDKQLDEADTAEEVESLYQIIDGMSRLPDLTAEQEGIVLWLGVKVEKKLGR